MIKAILGGGGTASTRAKHAKLLARWSHKQHTPRDAQVPPPPFHTHPATRQMTQVGGGRHREAHKRMSRGGGRTTSVLHTPLTDAKELIDLLGQLFRSSLVHWRRRLVGKMSPLLLESILLPVSQGDTQTTVDKAPVPAHLSHEPAVKSRGLIRLCIHRLHLHRHKQQVAPGKEGRSVRRTEKAGEL